MNNYDRTDVVFVIEKSISLKRYLPELLEAYISPTISCFGGGLSEDSDVFFTQSSLVQYGAVFYGTELSLVGSWGQVESFGPTCSEREIFSAINNACYTCKNLTRQAFILEGLQAAVNLFEKMKQHSQVTENIQRCCILITQSTPMSNPWSPTSPEKVLLEIKRVGIQLSIISAHKLVELYRLFDAAGGDQQVNPAKNYASKPQHLVLLNGVTLQERAVSPSLITTYPAVTNVPTPPTTIASGPGPSPGPPVPSPGTGNGESPAPQPSVMMHPNVPVGPNGQPNTQPLNPTAQPCQLRMRLPVNQNRPRWPGDVDMAPTLPSSQQPIQGPGPAPVQVMNPPSQRSVVWQGILEWQEKKTEAANRVHHQVTCKMTSLIVNGEPEVKAEGWASTLVMQMIPKNILGSIGNTFFKNVKTVMFMPDPSPALDILTAFLFKGMAGCVHVAIQNGSTQQSDVKVIILLFSSEKKAYVGFIPVDQLSFVNKIKTVIQSARKGQLGNPMMATGPAPNSSGAPPHMLVTSNSGMQSLPTNAGSSMNVMSSQNMIIQQNSQLNQPISQGHGGAQMSQLTVTQQGMGGQPGPGGGQVNVSIGGNNGGPSVLQSQLTTRPTLGMSQQQPSDQERQILQMRQNQQQQQQQQQTAAIRQQLQQQLQQRPGLSNVSMNIGPPRAGPNTCTSMGQSRMMQQPMQTPGLRQLLQQQVRFQQQQVQQQQQQQQVQQQQLIMMQQQGIRPQLTQQSQQVLGQTITQQGMGQQAMGQQTMGQQTMNQQDPTAHRRAPK